MVSLQRGARLSGALALLTGAYGFLSMMGAFGPVSCWTSQSSSGSASANGTETTTTPVVTHGCESGIDFLFGTGGPPGGGNASVLFSWAVVLLLVVSVAAFGVWTDRRRVVWGMGVIGALVSIIGIWSIGWYFMLPTLFTLVAAGLLTVDARGGSAASAST